MNYNNISDMPRSAKTHSGHPLNSLCNGYSAAATANKRQQQLFAVAKTKRITHQLEANKSSEAIGIMGNKQVRQHLETAQKTGILKISLQRLQEFPPQLKNYPNVLKTLDLSENRFERIPDELGHFTLVKHLNLSGNKLIELPDVIGELSKLEVLLLMNNYIVKLPKTLSNCNNLKTVNLSNNQIKEFPIMLCGLKHLDVLDLSRNKITAVPSEVGSLYTTELNLNQNQISILSEEIAACPKLKVLRLEENCLQASAFTPRILKESKICNLSVDGNLFNNKQFTDLEGYEVYMERYTAVKKKMF
ncbi:leucine-rich repeat-containing protein 57-like [Rhagoletis pomonella]|uniref:leucine-rich repeat-containing protein 57-like n=1 Tax=Rhagoletis pomonella TaxID=28610 RepID=UPI0017812920|nr:leucine-rich repeat-containing protein 57-like [Rhagoletis pomonella]